MKKFLILLALVLACPSSFAVLRHPVGSNGTPTVATCGTSPSVSGTDTRGVVTTGSGTVTACTLNFSGTLAVAPVCLLTTSATGAVPAITSVSTSALVIGLSATLTSGKIYYFCTLY